MWESLSWAAQNRTFLSPQMLSGRSPGGSGAGIRGKLQVPSSTPYSLVFARLVWNWKMTAAPSPFWWLIPAIPTLGKLREEACQVFSTNPGYTAKFQVKSGLEY